MSQHTPYVVDVTPHACSEGMIGADKRPSICLLAGLIVGGVSALVGNWVGFLSAGHQINDPIYLSISINSVLRGFLYFNWSGFLTPLIFSLVLGLFTGYTAKALASRAGQKLDSSGSGNAAVVAVIVSAAPVWVKEVSGFQVILMYALATWLSMTFAKTIAKRITH